MSHRMLNAPAVLSFGDAARRASLFQASPPSFLDSDLIPHVGPYAPVSPPSAIPPAAHLAQSRTAACPRVPRPTTMIERR